MINGHATTYKQAGVDIQAADTLIKRLSKQFPHIGGFGGLYPLGSDYLVAGADGVGTKLKLAFLANVHDTIGIDLVAMCVNDVITTGAKPLFFLDYFATSKLEVDKAEQVLLGIGKGCSESGCVLLGGETAEMPGFYHAGEYDLSGFCVGIVSKDKVVTGENIQEGDVVFALPSSGFHSNGYSLVRKVVEDRGISLDAVVDPTGLTAAQMLLTPTTLYVKQVQSLLDKVFVKGMAHITGGGLIENIPRILPRGLGVEMYRDSWKIPFPFTWLQECAGIADEEMFQTFNMGIGFVVIVSKEQAPMVSQTISDAFIVGSVVRGKGVYIQ